MDELELDKLTDQQLLEAVFGLYGAILGEDDLPDLSEAPTLSAEDLAALDKLCKHGMGMAKFPCPWCGVVSE